MIASTIAPKPTDASSCMRTNAVMEDAFRHQSLRRELFAAEADQDISPPKFGLSARLLQGADRHHGVGRGDRDAAAIGMG